MAYERSGARDRGRPACRSRVCCRAVRRRSAAANVIGAKRGDMPTKLQHWKVAVKPQAFAKMALPMGVGLAMGYGGGGAVYWPAVSAGLALALLAQISIVLLNDYADRRADRLHRRDFPQTLEPRVLADGLLRPWSVLAAGALAAGLLLGGGWALHLWGRGQALWLCLGGLALLWAYSYAPFKLNYRGGGEILEAVGVGGLLPWTGYYVYSGDLDGFPWGLAVPVLLLSLAGALRSGLAHVAADARTGKRTVAVWLGPAATQRLVLYLHVTAVIFVAGVFLAGPYGIAALFMGAILPTRYVFAAYRGQEDAGLFKGALGRAQRLLLWGLLLDFCLPPLG